MTFFYIIIIITKSFQQIEKHGEGMLGYGFCGISGHVPPLDVPAGQIILVQVIGACTGDTDQLQMICQRDGFFIDLDLVDH